MLELTGIAGVLRAVPLLYWALAVVSIALVAWKIRNWTYKGIGIAILISLFGYLPLQHWLEQQKRDKFARAAWAYFKAKCDTQSGARIYKTFTGVKSVLVVRPLPPASEKDLHDQFWYGDPYSNATPVSWRGESAARHLLSDSRRPNKEIQRGLDFIEIRYIESGNARYERIDRVVARDPTAKPERIGAPVSGYGVSWEDISTPTDRNFWVAGSRLRVIDLANNAVVAERIGFLIEPGFGSKAGHRSPWLASRGPSTTCPSLHGDYADQQFITSVFKQAED